MLGRIWTRWKAIGQRIGDFQARVILTVLYFLLLGPPALIIKLLRDPLKLRRPPHESAWIPGPEEPVSMESARRQF